jgi:hypothetical protein
MADPADDRAARAVYVSFYPSDWKGGTSLLPPLAEWTYLQICLHNWDCGEPLPDIMLRMVLCRNPDWENDLAWLVNIGKVIKTAGGGYFVRRALAEYQRAKDLIDKKTNAGKKGAEKRWGNKPLDSSAKDSACDSNGNQNQNQNQNQSKANALHPPTPHDHGDLIFSVPAEVWRDFKEHRAKIKAPMTERAERGILKKLEELHGKGHDPTEVLDQSIVKGWRDVFEVKGKDNAKRDDNDRRDGFERALDRRIDQLSGNASGEDRRHDARDRDGNGDAGSARIIPLR